jgi:phosphomannomutase
MVQPPAVRDRQTALPLAPSPLPGATVRPRLLAFDLDGTLAVSKSPISPQMASLLGRVIRRFDVCVISGGAFEQLQLQVVDRLDLDAASRERLHLMPTSGTRYHRYEPTTGRWELQYAHDLTATERERAVNALRDGAIELGMWEPAPHGEVIEDRGSQITFSALGQDAPPDVKHRWDADGAKKLALQRNVASRLPELEVRAGGTTSIDVTQLGADKGFGMRTLLGVIEIDAADVVFFGDQLEVGGNDHAVAVAGIESIAVRDPIDTELALTTILAMSNGVAGHDRPASVVPSTPNRIDRAS